MHTLCWQKKDDRMLNNAIMSWILSIMISLQRLTAGHWKTLDGADSNLSYERKPLLLSLL